MKILDCTFRDGGYYTNWHFSQDVVNNYLNSISQSGVDIVEIGFRVPQKDKFYGPFAYCADSFLKTLPLPKNVEIAIMVNAKDYIAENASNDKLLDEMFDSRSNSAVSLIRIAAHYHEIPALEGVTNKLRSKGYDVAINLMQTGTKTLEVISEAAKTLSHLDLRALYFADSLGNMDEKKIVNTIEAMRNHWKGEIGIHAHNNMGTGVLNTKCAYEQGATYLDGTVLGMGRGAGNAETENLLLEYTTLNSKYQPSPIFPIVLQDFKKLQEEYEWGPNLLYRLSAQYNIHPTFVQEILTSNSSTENMISALDNLQQLSNATSYSKEALNTAFKLNHTDAEGNWNPEQLFKNKDILILGSGPSVAKHKEAIEHYIKVKKPIVLSLNINKCISSEYIDLFAACHPVRLLSDIGEYKFLKKPLLIPFNSLSKNLQEKLSENEILNYGIKINSNHFLLEEKHCELPVPLVFAYALATATSGKANRVLVAGFDGYGPGDDRQLEMDSLLEKYFHTENHCQILSTTPTSYNMEQTTIYNAQL